MRFNFFGTKKVFDTAGGMRRRLIFNVVAAAVVFYSVFFVIHIAVFALTGIQIPNEYREAANVDLNSGIYSPENMQGEKGETVTVNVDGEEKTVKLLDNPLKQPKKKATYDFMDYDYEVDENDDFDI